MLGFLFAVIAGAAMSVQGVMNTRLQENIGLWEANAFVQGTAFVLSLAVMWIFGKGHLRSLTEAPWWNLLGGALGTDPRRLPEYFAAHGVDCTPCKKGALVPGVYVCSYTALSLLKEARGLHTAALRVTAAGVEVYNERDDAVTAARYPTAAAFFKGKTVAALFRVTAGETAR